MGPVPIPIRHGGPRKTHGPWPARVSAQGPVAATRLASSGATLPQASGS